MEPSNQGNFQRLFRGSRESPLGWDLLLHTAADDDPDRNIVQIWNAIEKQLLATILTLPDYRLEPKGRTVMKFEEPSNQPEALEAWFHLGDNYGHELAYPESRAGKAHRTARALHA